MAVTLGSAGITFSDATVQTTEATLLGAAQFTAYTNYNVRGTQAYSTTEYYTALPFSYFSSVAAGSSGASNTTLFCGFGIYRTGTSGNGDSTVDAGLLNMRAVYRSIGTA